MSNKKTWPSDKPFPYELAEQKHIEEEVAKCTDEVACEPYDDPDDLSILDSMYLPDEID